MSNQKIERLIAELSKEIKNQQLDKSTVEKIREFENQIVPYLTDPGHINNKVSISDQAKQLEIEFAQRHPVAEGILQEIIDTLSKMGI